MRCPFCNGLIGHKSWKNSFVICCEHCKYIYSIKGAGHLIAKTWEDDIPTKSTINSVDFRENSTLICVDSRHKMFLEHGTVISNDILHVRVDFGGTKIWMDKNSMQKMPEEWL